MSAGFKTHHGFYEVVNKDKYIGNVNRVEYRSSWELKVFKYLDGHPGVVKWNSEGVKVPYNDKASGKLRRYIVDLFVVKSNGEKLLIEIKPAYQTKPPKQEGKTKKRYIAECMTYATNTSKWEAASRYAKARGWTFRVLTEKEIGIRY